MAKERNLPSKTTLTTSDFIRVVGSDNASYKQSVSGVMTAMGIDKVVNGINNPSVNSLAELNDSGFYSIGTATNYSDAPTNAYGFLSVYNGGVYRIQTYYAPSELKEYVRYSTNSGTTWSAWTTQPTRAEIDALNSNKVGSMLRSGGTVTITLSKYTCAGMLFGSTNQNNGFLYSFGNGYLSPIQTATNVTATLGSDYKTITIENNGATNGWVGMTVTDDTTITIS